MDMRRLMLVATVFLMEVSVYVKTQSPEMWRQMAQDDLQRALYQRWNTNVAKNVILFIGDGMGISTITAARILKGQLQHQTGEETQLSFEQFPNVALSKTYSTDRQTSDSAATATALLCGVKTKWYFAGMDGRGNQGDCESGQGTEVSSMLHWSKDAGKSVGIVTTSRVTHATPASAYAHVMDRTWEGDVTMDNVTGGCKDIAYQLIYNNSDIDVIFGGGRRYFMPNNQPDPKHGMIDFNNQRNDGLDLIKEWKHDKARRGKRYEYVWNKGQFDYINPDSKDHVLGLFNPSNMEFELERDSGPLGEPSLAEMTRTAIKILRKNTIGFFLLVEGARIDHAHHASKAKKALHEVISLDKAVSEALELTSERDTLIIATADHSHVFMMGGYSKRGNNILGVADSVDPRNLPEGNAPYTTLSYGNGPGYDWGHRVNITNKNTTADEYVQVSAVPLAFETHAGEDVPIYARGPMSHLIQGVREQHYVAHVMAYAACVGSNTDHCTSHVDESCANKETKVHIAMLLLLFIISVHFVIYDQTT